MSVRRLTLLFTVAIFSFVLVVPESFAASTCSGSIPATITTQTNLVAAINAANSASCPGADTIDLNGATITLTTVNNINNGENGLPTVTTPITITNGTIERDSSAPEFRMVYNSGTLTLDNLTIRNFIVGGDGGALNSPGALTIIDSILENNEAYDDSGVANYGYGGAINHSSTLTLTGSILRGNIARIGGAINSYGNATLANSVFSGNSQTEVSPGATWHDNGYTHVAVNVTFAGNHGPGGHSAVQIYGSMTILNSVFSGNAGTSSEITNSGTLIMGNTLTEKSVSGLTTNLGGNTSGSASFVDLQPASYSSPTTAGDYALISSSSGVDVGNNAYLTESNANVSRDMTGDGDTSDTLTVDVIGDTRIQNTTVNMGAYETTVDTTCLGYNADLPTGYTVGTVDTDLAADLIQAIECANANGTDDIIDLGGQTVMLTAIDNTDFVANGLPTVTSNITIQNGTITRSSASEFRMIYNAGAGTLTISDLTISGFIVGHNGGAILSDGSLTVLDSILENNQAYTSSNGGGGAIYHNGTLLVNRSIIRGNSAYFGGGIGSSGNATVVNTVLSGNISTDTSGSAWYLNGGTSIGVNITAAGNYSNIAVGSAIRNFGTLTLINSIVTQNGSGASLQNASNMNVENTLYDGVSGSFTDLGGNIVGTASFVDYQTASTSTPTTAGDFSLYNNSAGVDTGDNSYLNEGTVGRDMTGDGDTSDTLTVDVIGDARIQNTTVNMGAYETTTDICVFYNADLPTGYTVGTVDTDLAADLIQAIDCANANGTDDIINLNGQTITFTNAPYDSGETALPHITSNITLQNGTLEGNDGAFRALYQYGGTLNLTNMNFGHFWTSTANVGIGGVIISLGSTGLNITNSNFYNNGKTTSMNGGVLYSNNSPVTISGSSFYFNQGSSGGVLDIAGANTSSIDNSIFYGNATSNLASAVVIENSTNLSINNSLLVGNSGGETIRNSTSTGTLALDMTNTTIAGNFGIGLRTTSGSGTTINNSILWSNSGIALSAAGIVNINHSAAESYGGATTSSITSGYTADEIFVTPLTAPVAGNTGLNYVPASYDWSLEESSPATDAGDNSLFLGTTDLAGATRKVDDTGVTDTGSGTPPIIDMGAYERQTSSCSSFAFPYTLSSASASELRNAITCANANATDDTIDLNGQTVTLDVSYATYVSDDTALPSITSNITINNGTIERDSTGGTPDFRLLYVGSGGNLTLDTVTLQNGGEVTNGGAIYNDGSLTIDNSTLTANTADSLGGAIYNAGTLDIDNTTLTNNTAPDGSAIRSASGSVIVRNSTVSNNTIIGLIKGNIASSGGTMTIVNSTIDNNNGYNIKAEYSSLTVVNSTVRGNDGGGIYINNGGATSNIINTLISGNGGIGLWNTNNAITILRNTTVAGNSNYGIINQATVRLYNTIVYGNNGGSSDISNQSTLHSEHSAYSGVDVNGCNGTCSDNITSTQAMADFFVDYQVASASTGTTAGDFTLLSSADAVDVGDNSFLPVDTYDIDNDLDTAETLPIDLAGDARIQNTTVNMGAYETTTIGQIVTVEFDSATSSANEATGIGTILLVTTSDSNVTASSVTVDVSVIGGTATAADYSLTGTITIPAGTANNTTVSIASGITITDDTVVEPDETVGLELSNPVGAVLGTQTTHTHTILNDDSATVTIADVSQAEGDTGTTVQTFTATLTGTVSGGFTVNYATTDGTALTGDSDYVSATGTLTFVGTDAETQTFTVTINGDTTPEQTEDFTVSLNTASVSGIDISDTATGSIVNDDTQSVTITPTLLSVTEGSTTDTFDISPDSSPSGTVEITVTPDAQCDIGSGAGIATVLSFTDTTPQTITVSAVDDTTIEGSHSCIISNAITASTASEYLVGSLASVVANITDNDSATVAFSSGTGTTPEATTPYQATVTLTITGGGTLPSDVTVAITDTAGTATTPADYTLSTTSVTFPTGSANGATQTVDVAIVNDVIAEGNHDFSLNLGTITGVATAGATTSHTVTITDDDVAGVTINPTTLTIDEDGTTDTYNISLNSVPTGTVEITVTPDAQCDIGSGAGVASVLSFTDTTPQTVTVSAVNDTIIEGAHSCTVTNAITTSGASEYAVGALTDVTGNITDNDSATIAFTSGTGSAAEGTTPYQTTVTLTVVGGGTLPSDVTVAITNTDGTATTPADYTLSTTLVTFSTGSADGATQTVDVAIVDDTIAEGNHDFTLNLGTITGVATAGTTTSHAVTIADNDTAGVTINPTILALSEGLTTDTFDISLNTIPTGTVQITVTPDAQCDIGSGAGVASVLSFTDTTPQTITVSAVDDAIVEGDHSCTITNAVTTSGASEYAVGALAGVVASITDNDIDYTITAANASVGEGTGTTTFTVARSGDTSGTSNVTVASSGSATSGADFTFVTSANFDGTTVSFTAGQTSVTITVNITQDSIDEGTETITLDLSGGTAFGTATISTASASTDITDDDTAGVTINPTTLTLAEGSTTDSFDISLNTVPTGTVQITVTPDAQCDIGSGAGIASVLSFTDTTPQTVTVSAVDDTVIEGSHSCAITNAITTSGATEYVVGALTGVTGNITDNDSVTVAFTSGTGSAAEGTTPYQTTVTLTIVGGGSLPADVTVAITNADGSATTPADYTLSTTLVTFPAGSLNEATQTVDVDIVDDSIVESNHDFTLNLGAITGVATAGSTTSHMVTIADNDVSGVTITPISLTIGESGLNDSFTINLDSTPTGTVEITVDPDDQCDIGSGVGISTVLTFTDTTPQTITVNAVDDTDFEGTHTCAITNAITTSAAGEYTVGGLQSVTATITDNDSPVVEFNSAAENAPEGTTPYQATIVLTTSIALPSDVTVAINQTAGTATTPDDYTLTTTLVTFIAGSTDGASQTVDVAIVDDALVDVGETFTLDLGAVTGGGALGTVTSQTVTIVDNDTPGITITPVSGTVLEGDSTTYTVVLNTQPSDDVDIALATGSAETTIDQPSLTFTSGDWDTPQTITLTVADNALIDGTRSATITHTASSGDGDYDGFVVSDYDLTIMDDDSPGILVSPTSDSVREGNSITYTIVLITQPTDDVTITLATGSAETTIDQPSLTFTSGDWDTPQTVTLSVADGSINGTRSATITHTASSADGDYDGISVDDFTLTIQDKKSSSKSDDDDTDDDVTSTPTPSTDNDVSQPDGTQILRLLGIEESESGRVYPPGAQTVWTFTVQNISGRSLDDIAVLVTYPDDDMVGIAAASDIGISGAFRKGSLLTEYVIGALAPDQIITLNITTQLPNRSGLFVGTISASVAGVQQQDQATLTRLVVQELPSTGESPLVRNLIVALFMVIFIAGLLWVFRKVSLNATY